MTVADHLVILTAAGVTVISLIISAIVYVCIRINKEKWQREERPRRKFSLSTLVALSDVSNRLSTNEISDLQLKLQDRLERQGIQRIDSYKIAINASDLESATETRSSAITDSAQTVGSSEEDISHRVDNNNREIIAKPKFYCGVSNGKASENMSLVTIDCDSDKMEVTIAQTTPG